MYIEAVSLKEQWTNPLVLAHHWNDLLRSGLYTAPGLVFCSVGKCRPMWTAPWSAGGFSHSCSSSFTCKCRGGQTDLYFSQSCMTLLSFSELSLLEYNAEGPGGSENIDGWHLLSRSGETDMASAGTLNDSHFSLFKQRVFSRTRDVPGFGHVTQK